MYRRYHVWRAPFLLWARIVCDILFRAVTAAAAQGLALDDDPPLEAELVQLLDVETVRGHPFRR
jgi:hypothetical protein